MESKKAPLPFAVPWGWADGEHGGFSTSPVALALLGVACGMVPYFCVAAMIRTASRQGAGECMPWCASALVGYLGKALFSTWSNGAASHRNLSYSAEGPQGTAGETKPGAHGHHLDTPSGQYKTHHRGPGRGMGPPWPTCCRR